MNRKSAPRASVVIPAYHSSSTIADCLDGLRGQTFRDFELIVVNSSQESETERIVRALYPEARFVQSPTRLLPHAARNLALQQARGELLVFTDPDCVASRDWLSCLATASDSGDGAIVGAMGLGRRAWWEAGVHLCKFHGLLPGLRPGVKRCAPTANAAYSRELWKDIGPFPGHLFAGDGIVSWRAAKCGQPPRFLPDAIVLHRHLEGFSGFCRQRFQRGRDFAVAQTELMDPPGVITWLRLLFSWAAIGWVLGRAALDALRAGWGLAFFLTLPIQVVGHELWAVGETWGAARLLTRRLVESGSIR
ncbi:MAG TPA: glycosyltransferase family 2 protein [Bryobacteraceae bacterium]|nr:glycosyltransferase family 2 protein [Bryobacteraceae bacterium]